MANGEQENTTPPSGGSVENPTANAAPPSLHRDACCSKCGSHAWATPNADLRLCVQRLPAPQRVGRHLRLLDGVGATILTLGIDGLYVFYQLVRRMRHLV